MKYRLRSLDVLSVAKLMACIHGCLGLLFMPIFVIVALAGTVAGSKEGAIAGVGMLVMAVIVPFFYAGMGFLVGALMAWLYNVISKRIGAIEFNLDPVSGAQVPAEPLA